MRADVLRVGGLRVPTRIGWTEEERAQPQEMEMEIEVHLHTRLAAATDDLDATVDYAQAAKAAVAALQSAPFRLLESAAEAVAAAVLKLGARRVRIRLRKAAPPGAAGAAFAEIAIERP